MNNFFILSLSICLLLEHGSARATTYNLPDNIGSGPFLNCSSTPPTYPSTSPTYSCTSKVDIGINNKLILTDDVTLNVSGEFKVADDSSVNSNGYDFNVKATKLHIDGSASMIFDNLTATGDVHIHKQANLTANVTSTGGIIKIDGGNNTINGNITANSGNLTIDSNSTVNGTCSPSHSQCTPLPSMINPTVVSQTTYGFSVIISGTYSSSVATSLNVTVNTVTYSLSTSSELTNSSDNWTLDLSSITALPPATYQVVATSDDGSGSLSDTTSNELVIIEYSAEWWNTNWTKCRDITIANTGTTTLSNFPVYIDLPYDVDMQSNYNDIRFMNTSCANGGFELDFEIETYTATSADVWVEIDNLPTAGTTIAVYYGNASAASGENIPGTWESSHKGVWHLSENTDAPNQDSTSNSNNGTPHNSPASVQGKIGNALNFNSSDKTSVGVSAADSLELSSYDNWTISLWVKPYTFGNEYPVMYTYGDYRASVGLDETHGKIEHYRNDGDIMYSDASLTLGLWQHVVVVYKEEGDTDLYLNGTKDSGKISEPITSDGKGSFIGGYSYLDKGQTKGYGPSDLEGLIDEVRVSKVARTSDWIKQSYDLVQNQGDHVTIGDEVEDNIGSTLTGTLNVDDAFEAYISTDDFVQGVLLTSGNRWQDVYPLTTSLIAGQDYYLHIKGINTGGQSGFLGDFQIAGKHTFSNGLSTLNTNITDWKVSKTGWSDYLPASAYGVNGVGPWGSKTGIDPSAQWIWSSNNSTDNTTYFSTKIAKLSPSLVAGRATLKNTTSSPEFTSVCFDTPFSTTPRVFSLPTTVDSNDRLALRIRNVTPSGFDIAQVESPESADTTAPDGNVSQTVDFLAILEGDYDLDGGAKMRVGSVATKAFTGSDQVYSDQSVEVIVTTDMGFSQTPAIIAFIQTMNNEINPFPSSVPFLATSVKSVTKDQFDIALERAETADTGALSENETMAYIAITSGAGQLTPDISYQSFLTNDDIVGTQRCQTFDLNTFNSNPLVIASQNTRSGGDGGWLRRCEISNTSVGFSIVEDKDLSEEGRHTSEIAGGIALGGTFQDFSNSCAMDTYYNIEHDGIGLTCDAEAVTITACTDASCSETDTTINRSVDLLVNGVGQTVNIVNGVSVNASFTHTETATPAVLSLASNYQCANITNNSASCEVTFSHAGFIFGHDTNTSPIIPTQLAGKFSNIGWQATPLFLQAVETDNTTGACVGLFPNGGNVSLNLSYSCHADSSACTEQLVLSNNNVNSHLTTTASAYNLYFTADSKAYFAIKYPDAGKIIINAETSVDVQDNAGNSQTLNFSASSHSFVVKPFGFDVLVANNPAAINASGNVFEKAGEPFNISLTAKQWVLGNDQNGDGLHNDGDTISGNATTVNFSAAVDISHSLMAPIPGANGTLTMINNLGFIDGIASKTVRFSEVGIIGLEVNIDGNNYLDAGDILGSNSHVGRFYPHHFTLGTTFEGALAGGNGFAYVGQMKSNTSTEGKISYSIEPEFTITAKSLNDSVTLNYSGDYMRLVESSVERAIPVSDATQLGANNTNKVNLTANLKTANLSANNGVVDYQFNNGDNFFYDHDANVMIDTFTSDIDLIITEISDQDGVTANDTDTDTTNGLLTLNPAGLRVYFGRWHIVNTFGPETSNLNVPMSIQYYNGQTFVPLTSEDNQSFSHTNLNVSKIDLSAEVIVTPIGNGIFAQGKTQNLSLSMSLPAEQGSVKIVYAAPPWLLYNWNNIDENADGHLFDDSPEATATFGVYRGNDRIISWREVYY